MCVAVTADASDAATVSRATELAEELSLALVGNLGDATDSGVLWLVFTPRRLELRESGRFRSAAVYVDLLRGATLHRLAATRSHRLPLARAIGLHRGVQSIVDATAGLGRDAVTLAACGCRLTAIERSGVLGALLRDGLARASDAAPSWLRDIADRVTLVVGDARDTLRDMTGSGAPEVVYLDPMFPVGDKKSLAKKEMRICRRLVGDDPDASELLAVAREAATRRVVVKRHPKAPPLAPRPSAQITGKLVRYDIYHSTRERNS